MPIPQTVPAEGAVVSPAPAAAAAAAPDAGPPAPASSAGATGFAPIDYFDEHCARCHGAYGSFYGDTFARNRDDAALRKVVKEMADGPGNAPLEDIPLEVLIAYHRSLIDKHPFLCLTRQSGGGAAPVALTGEATPGATVKVETAAGTVDAKLEEHTWTAALAVGTNPAQTRLVATRDGLSTSLDLARNGYSHSEAVTAGAGSSKAGDAKSVRQSEQAPQQARERQKEQSQ